MTSIDIAIWVLMGLSIVWTLCTVYNFCFGNYELSIVCLLATILSIVFIFGFVDGQAAAAKQEKNKWEISTEVVMYEENRYRVYEVITVD